MSGIANDHPRDRLSPYFDDELQVDERADVDRHLARCAACRDELEAMQRMAAAFASEPVPEMPEDLEVRVLHRLDLATILPLRRRGFFVPASIAATVAAVGLISVIAWKQGGVVAPPRSTSESVHDRPQVAEPGHPSGSREQREVELDAARPARPTDKLEASKPSDSAENAPQAPPPPPSAVEEYAPVPAESKELGKLKSDAVRQDDADAERQRSSGYAGDFGDAEAKLNAKDATAQPQSAVVAGSSSGALAPLCTRGTFEARDEGRWSVADLPRGLDDLRTVLGAVGGRLESFEPQTTRRAIVVIPRERYAEWIRAAKIRGVAGLADALPDGDGDCVRQQIRIDPPQRP